jgi:hypothetical protein
MALKYVVTTLRIDPKIHAWLAAWAQAHKLSLNNALVLHILAGVAKDTPGKQPTRWTTLIRRAGATTGADPEFHLVGATMADGIDLMNQVDQSATPENVSSGSKEVG